MVRAKDTWTIFLAADGRHTTLGYGDAVETPSSIADVVLTSCLEGWVAIMAGDYHGAEPVHLARVHAIFPTLDDKWPQAVESFMAVRDRVRGRAK